MTYYFDDFGWLSATPITGRSTTVAPPSGTLPTGFEWNFTGYAWVAVERNPAPVSTPPAARPRIVTKLQFMSLFTDAELAAIYTAAKSVIAIEIWLDKFKLATEVDLDDPQTADGQRALEAAGLIGAGRAAAILSNTPPAASAQV